MSRADHAGVKPVERRPLGRTGRFVSALGLGCASFWARPGFPEARARAVFDAALACGITLFDTGGSYAGGEAERRLGRMVKTSGMGLDDLVIATKAGTRADHAGRIRRDFSPDGIREQVHSSLERLGLERISLLQLHGPELADITEDLLVALERMRTEGKVDLIGINARSQVLAPLVGQTAFGVLMPFVSVVKAHNAGLARRAAESGQGILAAEPLARMRFAPPLGRWLLSTSGLWYLARSISQRGTAAERRSLKCLRNALRMPGWSRAQIALAWVLAQPGVGSAVFGTTRPAHVYELARACSCVLPDETVDAIAACNRRSHGDWA